MTAVLFVKSKATKLKVALVPPQLSDADTRLTNYAHIFFVRTIQLLHNPYGIAVSVILLSDYGLQKSITLPNDHCYLGSSPFSLSFLIAS